MNRSNLTVLVLLLAVISTWTANLRAENHPDVLTIAPDLEHPAIIAGDPAPGKMVLQFLPAYAGTEVAHALYLPTDWAPGKRFPVLIEYCGNGSRVRDGNWIGYGITGGKGFIWAVLPFVSQDHKRDLDWWWGDVAATVAYAKEAVPALCRQWGGDPAQIILVGHSRGAIACNYIGLHDDEIAKLWHAMIPFSHYDDGHDAWGMTPEEQRRAPERLRRLGSIPQFICGEHTSKSRQYGAARLLAAIKERNLTTFTAAKNELGLVPLTEAEGTRQFIAKHHPGGNHTIVDLPCVNHTAKFMLRDTPTRQQLREWLQNVLRSAPAIEPPPMSVQKIPKAESEGFAKQFNPVSNLIDIAGEPEVTMETTPAEYGK
ncbi:MAG: hypothetical protein NTW21_08330 [Verrucomicrobia bacterium]|nr:hypothetical protein [Verrucomicrobiota bacterium]